MTSTGSKAGFQRELFRRSARLPWKALTRDFSVDQLFGLNHKDKSSPR